LTFSSSCSVFSYRVPHNYSITANFHFLRIFTSQRGMLQKPRVCAYATRQLGNVFMCQYYVYVPGFIVVCKLNLVINVAYSGFDCNSSRGAQLTACGWHAAHGSHEWDPPHVFRNSWLSMNTNRVVNSIGLCMKLEFKLLVK